MKHGENLPIYGLCNIDRVCMIKFCIALEAILRVNMHTKKTLALNLLLNQQIPLYRIQNH